MKFRDKTFEIVNFLRVINILQRDQNLTFFVVSFFMKLAFCFQVQLIIRCRILLTIMILLKKILSYQTQVAFNTHKTTGEIKNLNCFYKN